MKRRDPDGPNVLVKVYLLPDAANAMERLAAIAKTSQTNIVNYALLSIEMLIDKGVIPLSVLTDAWDEEDAS